MSPRDTTLSMPESSSSSSPPSFPSPLSTKAAAAAAASNSTNRTTTKKKKKTLLSGNNVVAESEQDKVSSRKRRDVDHRRLLLPTLNRSRSSSLSSCASSDECSPPPPPPSLDESVFILIEIVGATNLTPTIVSSAMVGSAPASSPHPSSPGRSGARSKGAGGGCNKGGGGRGRRGGGTDEHSPLAAAVAAADAVSGTVRGAAANASAAVQGTGVIGNKNGKTSAYVRVKYHRRVIAVSDEGNTNDLSGDRRVGLGGIGLKGKMKGFGIGRGGIGSLRRAIDAAGGTAGEEEETGITTTAVVVHRTDPVPGNNDPVWAADTGSVFSVNVPARDLLEVVEDKEDDGDGGVVIHDNDEGGKRGLKKDTTIVDRNGVGIEKRRKAPMTTEAFLTFELRDRDMLLGTSSTIGHVRVDARELLGLCDERRVEFDVLEGESSYYYYHSMLPSSPLGSVHDGDDDYDGDDDDDTWKKEKRRAIGGGQSGEDVEEKKKKKGRPVGFSKPKEEIGSGEEEGAGGRGGGDADGGPKLALRFRLATKDDLSFLRRLERAKATGEICEDVVDDGADGDDIDGEANRLRRKKLLHPSGLFTEKEEADVGFNGLLSALSHTFNGTRREGDGTVRIRVKPYPDPSRPAEETKFMTESELRTAAYGPSTNWIEAGSGDLGRVYVEVIGCRGLPNLDSGEAVGNKTDSFVTIVYEDSILQTDVIDDSLSPLWMPWTQRAFAFRRMHPLSALYLAVFDYDIGPLNHHDGIGRIVINLSHLEPDVTHTLCYYLYPSSVITARDREGSITVRVRIESFDERKLLLAAATRERPRLHINVRKVKSLEVARYTVDGKYDEDEYDMTLLRSYINEIMEYKRAATYAIGDAMRSLFLWRGQVRVGRADLPLHSAAAFAVGVYAVERPRMLPGLSFLLVAWMMLANMTKRVREPSPWRRCRSFGYYLRILRTGTSSTAPSPSLIMSSKEDRGGMALVRSGRSLRRRLRSGSVKGEYVIKPFEGAELQKRKDDAWRKRAEADMEAANKRWELQQELDVIGDEVIKTKSGGIQIDPLARLLPYQKRVGALCYFFRILNMILTWEESMLSFWITLGSLGVAIVLFILPTAWIIHWLCRIAVWTLLGPWMKLVDVFVLGGDVKFHDEKEEARHREDSFKEILRNFHRMSREARLRGEEALKLKAMRILRFGRYIVSVPSMNVSRHYDYPLPDSYAHRSPGGVGWRRGSGLGEDGLFSEPINWDRRAIIPGQMLYGAMIPGPSSVHERQKRAAVDNGRKIEALRLVASGRRQEGPAAIRTTVDNSKVAIDPVPEGEGAPVPDKEEEGVEIELFDDTVTVDGEKCPLVAKTKAKRPISRIPHAGFDDVNGDILPRDDVRKSNENEVDRESMMDLEPVPSQIEPEHIMGMDDISVLSMYEPTRPARADDHKLQSLAEREEEEYETSEEGVEIMDHMPIKSAGDDEEYDEANEDDVTVTPTYRASDNVSIIFCRR